MKLMVSHDAGCSYHEQASGTLEECQAKAEELRLDEQMRRCVIESDDGSEIAEACAIHKNIAAFIEKARAAEGAVLMDAIPSHIDHRTRWHQEDVRVLSNALTDTANSLEALLLAVRQHSPESMPHQGEISAQGVIRRARSAVRAAAEGGRS